jgi:hypothetical protein
MMEWVLVFIGLTSNDLVVGELGRYESMTACFAHREEVIEIKGRPIVNYQAVCVPRTKETVTW